jgi:N-acetylglucosamine-6-phosphate deacetylase
LESVVIQHTKSTKFGFENVFELHSIDFTRVFYIQAATPELMDEWVNALEAAITGECSAPFDVDHKIHVNFNTETGFEVSLSHTKPKQQQTFTQGV